MLTCCCAWPAAQGACCGAARWRLGIAAIFDEGYLPEESDVKLKIKDANICSNVDVVCLAERRRNPMINAFLSMAIRVHGERGRLEWHQEAPKALVYTPLDRPPQ